MAYTCFAAPIPAAALGGAGGGSTVLLVAVAVVVAVAVAFPWAVGNQGNRRNIADQGRSSPYCTVYTAWSLLLTRQGWQVAIIHRRGFAYVCGRRVERSTWYACVCHRNIAFERKVVVWLYTIPCLRAWWIGWARGGLPGKTVSARAVECSCACFALAPSLPSLLLLLCFGEI